jgi:hypothetical protein
MEKKERSMRVKMREGTPRGGRMGMMRMRTTMRRRRSRRREKGRDGRWKLGWKETKMPPRRRRMRSEPIGRGSVSCLTSGLGVVAAVCLVSSLELQAR